MADAEVKTVDNENRYLLHEAGKGSAFVSGIFAVIILGMLIVNYLQIKLLDPLREERLAGLKVELLDQPKNEQLLSEIRELDLRIRKETLRRRDFSRHGAMLLLGAVVVFFISVKCVKACRETAPHPSPEGDLAERQVRQAVLARCGAFLGVALIAGGAYYFVVASGVEFKEVKPLYPSEQQIAENWAGFRGLGNGGISVYTNIPDKWNSANGEGILWKSAIPLKGHNSPVVWGDRVFVTGASREKREVYCFGGNSGELLWQREVGSREEEIEMDEGTGYAASTVVTDGRGIYAIFPTGDIAGFDFEGKQLWARNLGVPESIYGYASSLAMYRNLVIVQYDQATAEDNKSSILALDSFTGQTVWETKRDVPNSWTSPIVVKVFDTDQIITCADPWVIAYDPANGVELWRADCLGADVAPSPIYAGGLVFAVRPYSSLVAIDPNGSGDVTKTHIRWEAEGNIPDICSPVSNGELIFLLDTQGELGCYNVSDGNEVWTESVKGSFTASPGLVGDRLYMLSEKGVMVIANISGGYKELFRNELGERCYASPAFVDGRIYIRAAGNLYCIGEND